MRAPSASTAIGVLGGMGPAATLDFVQKVIGATSARNDQEHVPLVISCIPQVPDRTAAFRGEGESPLKAMVESGQRLVAAGCGVIVVPCNTAHLWFDELEAALGVPFIHLVDAALKAVSETVKPDARIGLLATDATIASGLYINRSRQGATDADRRWLFPTAKEMVTWVTPGIDAVKAGDLALGESLLAQAATALFKRGADALVLGCTEIPLVLGPLNSPLPVIDATLALARSSVAWYRSACPLPGMPSKGCASSA